jgi:hypothetical protein
MDSMARKQNKQQVKSIASDIKKPVLMRVLG